MDSRIEQYAKVDDETTPGEHHPEDETTGGGRYARAVEPNVKCLGCLHYDNRLGYCLVALVPTSCGDGSKPETGYAPLVPNAMAHQEWRQKRGLPFNAPAPMAADQGNETGVAKFETKILGDEGYVELSLRNDLFKDMGLHDTLGGFHAALKMHKPGSAMHTRLLASHANHAPLIGQLQRMGEAGSKVIRAMNHAANSKANAGLGVGARVMARSLNAKEQKPDLCKCGGKLVKGACSKCGQKSLRTTVAFDGPNKVNGPVMKSKWAIASAAWQKVSGAQKAKYVHAAMARHKKAGESIKPGKYAKRAPREFMERITHKSFAPSLVEEFGHSLGAHLYKARRLIQKAALAMRSSPSQAAGPSPILAAVRKRQMDNPTPESQAKARQAGGGKTFKHTALAEAAGVKPEAIADMAHQAHHVHEFYEQVRQKFGDKVKHLTSGQIRSAYHSTGLMHSMVPENDMQKALDFGTSNQDHAQAHAPHGIYKIHAASGTHAVQFHPKGGGSPKTLGQSHGGSRVQSFYEAVKMANAHASRHAKKFGKSEDVEKGRIALRSGMPNTFGTRGGPGPSEHRPVGKHQCPRCKRPLGRGYSCGKCNDATGKMHMAVPVKKSLGATNNPTDADVAKAMMAAGGAGLLSVSGMVNAPLNVSLSQEARATVHAGLPDYGELVEFVDDGQQSAPEVPAQKSTPTVGGVLSAAWDLGQSRY
jgi:hypothetical protein